LKNSFGFIPSGTVSGMGRNGVVISLGPDCMGWHRGVLIAGEDRPADAGRQMKDGYGDFNSLYAFAA